MIPLASIEGNVVFVIVAAVVGVINWIMEKSKKASGGKQAPPAPRPPQPPANAGGESEQERLRRFLEALGVPQPPQPPRPAQPQIAQPSTQQAQPILRRVAKDIKGRMPSPRAAVQSPAKAVRPPKRAAVQEPGEFATAGRIEEAAASIEKISGEFSAMNVRVRMDPVQSPDRPAHLGIGNAGTTSVLERSGSPIAATLRKLLHNPTDLRATFVAMEVLGTPRGLQG